ncbi:MAG: hypothetical protein JSU01_22925 [Bacteroidetes bacterium]|nr:hypothetical protein [Bacteroidota bacterium]
MFAFSKAPAQQLSTLKPGPYKVGFRAIHQFDGQGRPLAIGVWYPAASTGKGMALKDYIIAGSLSAEAADSVSTNEFKRILELPFLYHLDKVPADVYRGLISMPLRGFKNAAMRKGKFPLIITLAAPDAYPVTFEYFASHGFVVASIVNKYDDVQNDSLIWTKPTNDLAYLLKYMTGQAYVDTNRIAAFGHGGGIQPAFYLAMRTPKIKLLVNLDGGVFSDRSKTTLSPDYKPAQLRASLLYISTQAQKGYDDPRQWNILRNSRFKVLVRSEEVRHHDFTMWGILVAEGLHQRGESAKIVEDVFANVHTMILQFLNKGKLAESGVDQNYFEYSAAD